MGAKIDYLLYILEKNKFRHLHNSMPQVKEETIHKSGLFADLREAYLTLGGNPAFAIPYSLPQFSLEFEQFAVILDEEESFNRYRAITLKAPFYSNQNFFSLENYKRYCRQFEGECLKAARSLNKWTDRESEKYFGASEAPGDLALQGSARWKYNAFTNLLQDATAAAGKFKLIRLSIYDNLMVNNQIIKLNNLLTSRNPSNEKYLFNFFQRRISG